MFFLHKSVFQGDETLGNAWASWGAALTSSAPRSGGIDWNAIISRGFDLGSQAMQSFGGRTVGTQTYGSSSGVMAINAQPQSGGYDQAALAQQYALLAAQRDGGPGSTIGGGVDGVLNWMLANPVYPLVGVAALYLLFREPPRRR